MFAFDSTMTRYALRFRDGTIEVRRVADDQQIACFHAAGHRDIWVFCFSPDGRYLATTHDPGHALMVWDVDRRAIAVRDPGRVWRGGQIQPGQPANCCGPRGRRALPLGSGERSAQPTLAHGSIGSAGLPS